MQEAATETASDSRFLFKDILFPKYFDSKGNIAIPTIINVQINRAICAYPAPAPIKEAASGKATKPGMRVMQPAAPAMIIPFTPDFEPSNVEIISSSKTESNIPIRSRMESIDGSIFMKALPAFINEALVFFLSLQKDTQRDMAAAKYKNIANLQFSPPYFD